MSVISIFRVLDKLEGAIRKSSRIPLTNYIVMDSEKLLGLLEKMRGNLPEEMKQARWVSKENQRILAEAQAKADRVILEAREEAARLVASSEIMRQAQEQAEELAQQAEESAHSLRVKADAYAREVLSGIETELGRIVSLVQDARGQMQPKEPPAPASQAAPPREPARTDAPQQMLIG